MITMNPSRHRDQEAALRVLMSGTNIDRMVTARLAFAVYPLRHNAGDVFGRIIRYAHGSICFNLDNMCDDTFASTKLSYLTEARLMAAACVREASYSTPLLTETVRSIALACLRGVPVR